MDVDEEILFLNRPKQSDSRETYHSVPIQDKSKLGFRQYSVSLAFESDTSILPL